MSQLEKRLSVIGRPFVLLERPTAVRGHSQLKMCSLAPIILLLGHVVFKEPQTLCETYRPV